MAISIRRARQSCSIGSEGGNNARSMATVVSDAKRKRELERLVDLSPREIVEVEEVLQELTAFAAVRAERKRIEVVEMSCLVSRHGCGYRPGSTSKPFFETY